MRHLRFVLSPHCAVNCLRHVISAPSCATHVHHIEQHVVLSRGTKGQLSC